MSDFCLVRQPIFGSTGALLGYEIRFKETETGENGFAESFLSGTFVRLRRVDRRPKMHVDSAELQIWICQNFVCKLYGSFNVHAKLVALLASCCLLMSLRVDVRVQSQGNSTDFAYRRGDG